MSDLIIATVELASVTADGERTPVRLQLGQPVPDGSGAWTCAPRLDGLHAALAPVVGEDELQALCLALALAAEALRSHVARGGRLEYAAGGEFPLQAYFGWLGQSSVRDG